MKTIQEFSGKNGISATITSNVQAESKTAGFTPSRIQQLTVLAAGVTRYGLVILLLGIGLFKFTNFEAQAIQPLVANSPFMSWLYNLLDAREVSALIGLTEIIIAILIAIRPWNPRISAFGSIGGVLMFATTLTFLITTPGMWTVVEGFIVPTDGGFLLKDFVLLGGSLWTAAEALQAAHLRHHAEKV